MASASSTAPRGVLPLFFGTLILGKMVRGPPLDFLLRGMTPFHRAMDRALLVSALGALAWAWPRLDFRAWWPPHRRAAGQVLLGLLIAFISIQTILGLDAAFGGITWSHLAPRERTGLIVKALLAALIVPLAEETIFRGFLQTEFSRTLGNRGGWIVAALVFALAHFLKVPVALDHQPVHWNSGPPALAAAFAPVGRLDFLGGKGLNLLLIGLILGALFWRTGMLWLNYGLHGGWIFGLLLASGLSSPGPVASIWTGADLLSSPLTSLVLVLLGFWLWLFFRRPPPDPANGATAP